LILLIVLLVLELMLRHTFKAVDAQLSLSEKQVSEYQTFDKYLRRKDRTLQMEKLTAVQVSLRFLHGYRLFLGSRRRALAEAYSTRAKNLRRFLEHFIPEFMKKEVGRHGSFFERTLTDQNQTEAIVKNDVFSLIVAAAGSGKTRVLTARYAFMVECGVDPESMLALAYTNPAREEMLKRLRNQYGLQNANVRTFHSFARELARQSPHFRTDVASSSKQRELIADAERLLRSDRVFAKLLLEFALELRGGEPDPREFAQPEKLYEYMRNQRYVTLNGTNVKSMAERDIANFFLLNRVRFAYEVPATWTDKDMKYRQYHPDFYLPEYGIWVEHWAVDRRGNVPAWFSSGENGDSSTRYREGMEWKRNQFKKHGRKLIETYHYQWSEGSLVPGLKHQLEQHGVRLNELSVEEILSQIQKLIPHAEPLRELMFSFISKAKTNGFGIDDIKSKLVSGQWSRRERAFASLMVQVWQQYEFKLKENGMIDFSDMVRYALQVAREHKSPQTSRYSHILIDEFQDITDTQLDLIKCLLDRGEHNTLFCVGDDRQNIFSFAGSNVHNILNFDNMFPFAEQTALSTNYRCPKNIVGASNAVASLNKLGTKSEVIAANPIERPITLMEMTTDGQTYEDWEFERATRLLSQLLKTRSPGEEIMVLARYNFPLRRLEVEFPHHESSGLRFLSIHRAKGTEADYVLLLSCISGKNGFPSEVLDQRVLDITRRDQMGEADKFEEERRLFYVALTRCKKQLFMFTSKGARSRFVFEIEKYLTVSPD